MKKLLLCILFLCVLTFSLEGFVYDPNMLDYPLIPNGEIQTTVGEPWTCSLNWRAPAWMDVSIALDSEPDGMYVDMNTPVIGWTPGPNDVGLHYLNMHLGRWVPDTNSIRYSDHASLVIFVEEEPVFLPMCGG